MLVIQRFSELLKKLRIELKGLLLTKAGWIAWFIANVITSLLWFIPLAIGWLFNIPQLIVTAGSIWTFMLLPITPFWAINLLIAMPIRNKIKNVI